MKTGDSSLEGTDSHTFQKYAAVSWDKMIGREVGCGRFHFDCDCIRRNSI
jgi:hypothetical protein